MGVRFRKSKKVGPFRVTVSKSGVSTSFGGKGARITKTASGKVRTTLSIPGTGLSYVSETSGKKKKPSKKAQPIQVETVEMPQEPVVENKAPVTEVSTRSSGIFLVCVGVPLAFLLPPLGIGMIVLGVCMIVKARDVRQRDPESHEQSGDSDRGINAPALASAEPWDVWDVSVHCSEGQPERMQRALSQDLQVGENYAPGCYRVKGSKGDWYQTSFSSCTCQDFSRRGLPCKHIYSLAMQIENFDPKPFIIRTDVTAHPLRGFMNLGMYKVKGMNPKTNRLNTRTVYAVDEATAIFAVRAAEPGLVEPFTAQEAAYPPPAPEELEKAALYGLIVPDGAVGEDVAAILERHEHFDPPTIFRWQWELAASFGIRLSALAGERTGRDAFHANHKRWRNEPPAK